MSAERSPYFVGSYAPIDREIDADCTIVLEGEIPKDLDGTFVRNGPNNRFTPKGRYHWFDGDGMLHAVRIRDGKVHYKNRWVQTKGLTREVNAGGALWGGIMDPVHENPPGAFPYKDTANTDVIFHAGVLKALWYLCGKPYDVDPNTLETIGPDDFGGTYKGVVSAHSKVDERTGELLFFDYGIMPPFMHFGVADATGKVVRRVPVELPGPRLPHDLAITERFAILMDLPVVLDEAQMAKGRWRSLFRRDMPARFALVSRDGSQATRWFEADACYIYHSVNAWEEGDEVVLVACRVTDPFPTPDANDGAYAAMMASLRVHAELHEFRFNLATGETRERKLDDRRAEFPMMDRRRIGRRSRYAYNVLLSKERTLFFEGLVKYDTETGSAQTLDFGPGRRGSESPFAPRRGSTVEDDGYVLSFVHDEREDRSELWIMDAKEIRRGPVARVAMPQRVPLGFHGVWVPGEKLH